MAIPAKPTLTPPTPAPNRLTDTEDQFTSKAVDRVLWQSTNVSEMTTTISWVDTVFDATEAEAASAAADAQTASESAGAAVASANYQGPWSSLSGSLNKPATVFHDGAYWRLNTDLADVTASEPSVTNSDWQYVSGTTWGALVTADQTLYPNSLVNVLTSGTIIELSLPAALNVGDYYIAHNSIDSDVNVRIANNGYSIKGPNGTISPGDDLVIRPGDTVNLIVKSSSVLESV